MKRGTVAIQGAIPITSAEDAQDLVAAWLEQFGCSCETVSSPDLEEQGFPWALEAKTPSGVMFVVGWRSSWSAIQVQFSFGVSEHHQAGFRMMSLVDKMAFLSDLASFFHSNGLEFELTPAEEVTEKDDANPIQATPPPTNVLVTAALVVDGAVSRKEFVELYKRVLDLGSAASHMFNKMAALRSWS